MKLPIHNSKHKEQMNLTLIGVSFKFTLVWKVVVEEMFHERLVSHNGSTFFRAGDTMLGDSL